MPAPPAPELVPVFPPFAGCVIGVPFETGCSGATGGGFPVAVAGNPGAVPPGV